MNANPLITAEFLISIEQKEDAKKVLDVMKKYCVTLPQIDAVGKLYSEIREFEDCLELAQKALRLAQYKEDKLTLKTNIVRALINLNRPLEALKVIHEIAKDKPKDHPNMMDEAMCLFLLNKKDEGEALLQNILKETHNDDINRRVRFNLGTYNLRKGNFKEGLRGFLLDGRELDIWKSYKLPIERNWTGGIQPGKTILVCAEGGIGDEIISVRFLKHLKERGMNPIWFTDRKDLAAIFNRNGFKTITSLNEYQYDWLWCYGMPTPCYLDVSEEELWSGPYLKPLNQKPQLSGKLKIGLKCSGNAKYDQDLHRTIPFKETIDNLPEHATIYSFHVDEDIDDPRVISLKDKIKTWDDTLDYLNQMDILISSCTSLPHAAGAIGKKTIIIVPILTYYTYAYPSLNTKWYSENTRILRQTEYDNWNAPLSELKEIMKNEYTQD